ncbi:Fe-S cluster assembly protein SufD [Gammaproteobacteria bacterium LSUCC0112]|nr:Fe-S cluster assembly protein SufD [Gammaproteobacteria bacterium LSUCC0112]
MSAPTSNSRQSIPAPQSPFQKHALALAAMQNITGTAAGSLLNLRQQGSHEFERATWPGRKVEHWKYTSVQSLISYENASWAGPATLSREFLQQQLIPLQATRLIFVDGVFDPTMSDMMPEGVSLFSQADVEAADIIDNYLGKVAGSVDASRRNLFASLNSAWTQDGLLIHVAHNVILEKPVYLVYVNSPQQSAVTNVRTLLVMEQSANLQLVEHFLSADSSVASHNFVNAMTEIQLGQNAQLHHTRLNLEQESVSHIGAVHINLMRDSAYNGFTVSEGSKLKRLDYQMNHCGQGASLILDGVYLARHDQQVDYHTCIEHRVPHCTSQQVFRGIVGDKAKAVFNGRIHIFEDAQKTLAEMSNRNLLTSNTAEINTKPELEIYADDVKCAHGATISQLDETALYYLMSRGISPAQAHTLLSFGFINELLASQPLEAVNTWLETWLRNRFSEDRSLISDIKPAVGTGGSH